MKRILKWFVADPIFLLLVVTVIVVFTVIIASPSLKSDHTPTRTDVLAACELVAKTAQQCAIENDDKDSTVADICDNAVNAVQVFEDWYERQGKE